MKSIKESAEEYAAHDSMEADSKYTIPAYLAGAAAAQKLILADLCQMLAVTEEQREFGNAMLTRIRNLIPE